MATKTCSCGKVLDWSASQCPNCGKRWTGAFVWGAFIFALFLAILVWAVALKKMG